MRKYRIYIWYDLGLYNKQKVHITFSFAKLFITGKMEVNVKGFKGYR